MVGVPTFEIIIDREYPGFNPVQFGYEDCRPGHAVGPGIRTHWLLHYVVWGKGIFCRDGVTHEVRPGDIFVIPPYEETYYEGVTLSREEFYSKMEKGANIVTSQPAPSDVMSIWDKALETHDEIVHIPMSSGLSGSCQNKLRYQLH